MRVPHTLKGNENGGPQGGCQAQGTGFLRWVFRCRNPVAWACSLAARNRPKAGDSLPDRPSGITRFEPATPVSGECIFRIAVVVGFPRPEQIGKWGARVVPPASCRHGLPRRRRYGQQDRSPFRALSVRPQRACPRKTPVVAVAAASSPWGG